MRKIHKREKEMLIMKLSEQRRAYGVKTTNVIESIVVSFDPVTLNFIFDKYDNYGGYTLIARESYTLQEIQDYLDIDDVWFAPFNTISCACNNRCDD